MSPTQRCQQYHCHHSRTSTYTKNDMIKDIFYAYIFNLKWTLVKLLRKSTVPNLWTSLKLNYFPDCIVLVLLFEGFSWELIKLNENLRLQCHVNWQVRSFFHAAGHLMEYRPELLLPKTKNYFYRLHCRSYNLVIIGNECSFIIIFNLIIEQSFHSQIHYFKYKWYVSKSNELK